VPDEPSHELATGEHRFVAVLVQQESRRAHGQTVAVGAGFAQ
jgi:hypothetical protein